MSRRVLVLLGSACLVLAIVLHPTPAPQSDGVLAAVGRSMGGSRVMVIDALFLRAEAQRKAGRIEDAAALYRTVLDLDPANEPATIFLVNVYVDEMIPQIPDPERRWVWWLQARELLDIALARRPDSAPLHARAAGLALDARRPGGILELRPAPERQRWIRNALVHLERAVALTDTLPRLGRVHLVQVSLLAPEQAAEGLKRREPDLYELALRVGEAALAQRGDVLTELRLEEEEAANLGDVLRTGLAAARAVDGGDEAEARRLIARTRALVPEWHVPGILEDVLRR